MSKTALTAADNAKLKSSVRPHHEYSKYFIRILQHTKQYCSVVKLSASYSGKDMIPAFNAPHQSSMIKALLSA